MFRIYRLHCYNCHNFVSYSSIQNLMKIKLMCTEYCKERVPHQVLHCILYITYELPS